MSAPGGERCWGGRTWEFIHEIAVGEVALDCPRVALVRQDFPIDSHLVAEERELLLLGFEISKILIPKDEVESNEPRSNVFVCASVFLLHDLSGKGNAAFAGFHLDELKKLMAGEIPGMRCHKVEETGLLFRIAEISKCLRVDGEDFHRAKILALIS